MKYMKCIKEIFHFPYINREEKTARTIIDNDKNIVFEKRNSNNELIGCAIVNDNASTFFEKRGYKHSWEKCNCFDMQMSLDNIKESNNTLEDTINGITFRWTTKEDIDSIVECADDACQYQDEKFSKYYTNPKLYEENNNQKVLVAVKDNKIVGTLIVSIETEGKDLGCVECTCVSFKETRQVIGTNLVMLGTKYLKDIGLKNASLSYTYTGLDKLYGSTGYEISTYYLMGEKTNLKR